MTLLGRISQIVACPSGAPTGIGGHLRRQWGRDMFQSPAPLNTPLLSTCIVIAPVLMHTVMVAAARAVTVQIPEVPAECIWIFFFTALPACTAPRLYFLAGTSYKWGWGRDKGGRDGE